MRISILTTPVEKNTKITQDRIGGHYAVTRSLINGLRRNFIDYIYNPDIYNITSTVVVLSGADTLESAIALKRTGKIKYIAAGPNISVYATDFNSILGSDDVDLCIVPSAWVANLYIKDIPKLRNRIFIWPAGVDQDYWSPSMFGRKKNCLVYVKDQSYDLQEVRRLLASLNINFFILRYGEYTARHYRRLLRSSSFAIFISGSESQGIALQECWSTNTPTLVWKNSSIFIQGESKGMIVDAISTAPYLNEQCGHFWKTANELKKHIVELESGATSYRPRQWIMKNMTDRISSKVLIEKLLSESAL